MSEPLFPSTVRALINTDALADNVRALTQRIHPATLMCVVKADAYGHTPELVVPAALAAGARAFGVATPAEALAVHALIADSTSAGTGEQDPVQVLCWLYDDTADLAPLISRGIEIALPRPQAVEQLRDAAARAGVEARVHLKVDTGLGRNGLTPVQLDQVLADLSQNSAGIVVAGVMTHLASADEPEDPANTEQLGALDAALNTITSALAATPGLHRASALQVHASNSPAALTMRPIPGTMARVGLSLYGLSPLADVSAADLELRPVMRLVSRVLTVKDVSQGQGASYGLTYRAPRDTRFALIAGGYGDGIPRAASNSAQVTIRGRRYPVVGRIAMDQMIADVGLDSPVELGDEVVIMGDGATGPSAEEWGEWSHSVNYEIITRIHGRVDRVEVTDAQDAAAHGGAAWHPGGEASDRALALTLPDLDATESLGLGLAEILRAGDLVILNGDLGAGKTTLTQSLAAGLGVRGRVSSPTFIIAREHDAAGDGPGLVHVDAYRLGSAAELADLDLDSRLDEVVTVVEWGTGLAEQLSEDRLEIQLTADPVTEQRSVTLEARGESWMQRAAALRSLTESFVQTAAVDHAAAASFDDSAALDAAAQRIFGHSTSDPTAPDTAATPDLTTTDPTTTDPTALNEKGAAQ